MQHKSVIILKALLDCKEVKINNKILVLDADNNLCEKIINNHNEEVYLKVNFGDLALKEFISFCEKTSFEEISKIIVENTEI